MSEEQKQKIEEAFRRVASQTIENSKKRFRDGNRDYEEAQEEKNINSEFEPQTLFDSAGENYAFATEIALKANLIYDDFRKNQRFNQDTTKTINIGGKDIECYGIDSSEWHHSLAADKQGTMILNDPKEIKKLILENNPVDERKEIITSENRDNPTFKSLKFDDERKASGHSLYAYYQLQSDIAKNLINTEYYCYVEDEVKYTVYALLTEDILSTSGSDKTIIPKEMMETLNAVKESAIDLRYASISGVNLTQKEFQFLHNFSRSVINVGEYRFPLPKEYNQIDFEKYDYNDFHHKGIYFFDKLDKMSKYYLQSCFSRKEMELLLSYVELLTKAKTDINDINIFVNNCIYFKNYTKNKMQINLAFTEKQYGRIDNFCKLTKAFQPFDENSILLRENEAFSTEEKRDYYKKEIKKNQKETKENSNSINKNTDYIINTINQFLNDCNWYWDMLEDCKLGESETHPREWEKYKKSFSIIKNLLKDKSTAIEVIKNSDNSNALEIYTALPDALKDDEYITRLCIDKNPLSIKYASERLKANKDICREVIKKDPQALELKFIREALKESLNRKKEHQETEDEQKKEKTFQSKEKAIEAIRKANPSTFDTIFARLSSEDVIELCMQYSKELDNSMGIILGNINSVAIKKPDLTQIEHHIELLQNLKELEQRKELVNKYIQQLADLNDKNSQNKVK